MFENVLLNNKDITVRLNVDYFAVKEKLPKHKLLVFTGPIDAFYASQGLAKLEYRSIFWEREYLEPPTGFFQPAWVVNYPGGDVGRNQFSFSRHRQSILQAKTVVESSTEYNNIHEGKQPICCLGQLETWFAPHAHLNRRDLSLQHKSTEKRKKRKEKKRKGGSRMY